MKLIPAIILAAIAIAASYALVAIDGMEDHGGPTPVEKHYECLGQDTFRAK